MELTSTVIGCGEVIDVKLTIEKGRVVGLKVDGEISNITKEIANDISKHIVGKGMDDVKLWIDTNPLTYETYVKRRIANMIFEGIMKAIQQSNNN